MREGHLAGAFKVSQVLLVTWVFSLMARLILENDFSDKIPLFYIVRL
jgi:hypothetical protein